jgi:hypothetical protein
LYVCETGTRFFGCCNNDPCRLGCKQGDLEPTSFNPAAWSTFPDLECSSGQFWTCRDTSPPFMGCCRTNPCSLGCPIEDLSSAFLGNNEAIACQFYPDGCPSSSSSSTKMASTVSSTQSAASSTTTSAVSGSHSSTSSASPKVVASPKTPTGPIVGGAVGGIAGFIIVALLIFCCYRHAAKSRRARNSEVDAQTNRQSVKTWNSTTDAFSEASTHYQGMSTLFPPYHSSRNKGKLHREIRLVILDLTPSPPLSTDSG